MDIEEYPLSENELDLCPFCKDKAYYVSAVPGCWFVRCGYCRAETNVYQSKEIKRLDECWRDLFDSKLDGESRWRALCDHQLDTITKLAFLT